MSLVLDASAVLTFLLNERGADRVASRLEGSMIASTNISEIVGFYAKLGADGEEIRSQLTAPSKIVMPIDADVAFEAGMLHPLGARFGLSLGDRTCLALAKRSGLPAMTADRAWTEFGRLAGIEIDLIR